jgi:hypothetical protein
VAEKGIKPLLRKQPGFIRSRPTGNNSARRSVLLPQGEQAKTWNVDLPFGVMSRFKSLPVHESPMEPIRFFFRRETVRTCHAIQSHR